jgi:transcriptional regulator with XRE-family HTH domain
MPIRIEPFYADLGRRIYARRTSIGMTQEKLAQSLTPPTTRASIANLEAGKQRVLLHTFIQISQALGLSASDLLFPAVLQEQRESKTDITAELREKLNINTSLAEEIAETARLAVKSIEKEL